MYDKLTIPLFYILPKFQSFCTLLRFTSRDVYLPYFKQEIGYFTKKKKKIQRISVDTIFKLHGTLKVCTPPILANGLAKSTPEMCREFPEIPYTSSRSGRYDLDEKNLHIFSPQSNPLTVLRLFTDFDVTYVRFSVIILAIK